MKSSKGLTDKQHPRLLLLSYLATQVIKLCASPALVNGKDIRSEGRNASTTSIPRKVSSKQRMRSRLSPTSPIQYQYLFILRNGRMMKVKYELVILDRTKATRIGASRDAPVESESERRAFPMTDRTLQINYLPKSRIEFPVARFESPNPSIRVHDIGEFQSAIMNPVDVDMLGNRCHQ